MIINEKFLNNQLLELNKITNNPRTAWHKMPGEVVIHVGHFFWYRDEKENPVNFSKSGPYSLQQLIDKEGNIKVWYPQGSRSDVSIYIMGLINGFQLQGGVK